MLCRLTISHPYTGKRGREDSSTVVTYLFNACHRLGAWFDVLHRKCIHKNYFISIFSSTNLLRLLFPLLLPFRRASLGRPARMCTSFCECAFILSNLLPVLLLVLPHNSELHWSLWWWYRGTGSTIDSAILSDTVSLLLLHVRIIYYTTTATCLLVNHPGGYLRPAGSRRQEVQETNL